MEDVKVNQESDGFAAQFGIREKVSMVNRCQRLNCFQLYNYGVFKCKTLNLIYQTAAFTYDLSDSTGNRAKLSADGN